MTMMTLTSCMMILMKRFAFKRKGGDPMNDILEKTALNEILKTVAYIAEK